MKEDKQTRQKLNEERTKVRTMVRTVRAYYRKHGRHELPWRHTTDPYRILVSETMLQQTQVPRVISKYHEFLTAYPTVDALATATLGDVLRTWQGLGYNRRAKLLQEGARHVVAMHGGTYPRTYEALMQLPGVGPYTAAAVMAFAYNVPRVMIETNIRTVYLHHFFGDRQNVPDAELLPYIAATLDNNNPRTWYAALMDYGTHLKQSVGNVSRRSRHYTKQSAFKGSTRYVRGALLRLLAKERMTRHRLIRELPDVPPAQLDTLVAALCAEGLVVKTRSTFHLP